ncbi:MAG: hypothetical protein ACE5D7_01400 [Fidelibacterota bacterium]
MAQALVPLAIGSLFLQGATAISARSAQRAAGGITERQSEIEAKQEELGAIQREADRKGRLSSALATQIASAGTKSIAAFEGSPLRILQADIEAEEVATERDIFSTRLAALTKRTRGKTQRSLIEAGADIGALKSISQIGFQAAQLPSVLGAKKGKN